MLEKRLALFKVENRSLSNVLHYLSYEVLEREVIVNTEILNRDTAKSENATSISLSLKDTTVAQILDAIVAVVGGRYYWQQFGDSHIVSVIPRKKDGDSSYPPNVTIDEFRYKDITPYSCMREAICDGLGGELGEDWMFRGMGHSELQPQFDISLQQATIRQILNTMSRETDYEWHYRENHRFSFWGRVVPIPGRASRFRGWFWRVSEETES